LRSNCTSREVVRAFLLRLLLGHEAFQAQIGFSDLQTKEYHSCLTHSTDKRLNCALRSRSIIEKDCHTCRHRCIVSESQLLVFSTLPQGASTVFIFPRAQAPKIRGMLFMAEGRNPDHLFVGSIAPEELEELASTVAPVRSCGDHFSPVGSTCTLS
jgi:hypothetical protein